jgi:hypothetical protein
MELLQRKLAIGPHSSNGPLETRESAGASEVIGSTECDVLRNCKICEPAEGRLCAPRPRGDFSWLPVREEIEVNGTIQSMQRDYPCNITNLQSAVGPFNKEQGS